MQYPAFRQRGWPIGSGMVESANKNIVEARLKGPGMHWQRKQVNPMLALRNAVCNDRWQEMWQKAILHQRTLQAFQRSARAKPQVRAFLAVRNSSSQLVPPQSVAVSEQIAPPAPCEPTSKALSASVTPSTPVPLATRPHSFRPSTGRKRHTARNRVK